MVRCGAAEEVTNFRNPFSVAIAPAFPGCRDHPASAPRLWGRNSASPEAPTPPSSPAANRSSIPIGGRATFCPPMRVWTKVACHIANSAKPAAAMASLCSFRKSLPILPFLKFQANISCAHQALGDVDAVGVSHLAGGTVTAAHGTRLFRQRQEVLPAQHFHLRHAVLIRCEPDTLLELRHAPGPSPRQPWLQVMRHSTRSELAANIGIGQIPDGLRNGHALGHWPLHCWHIRQ